MIPQFHTITQDASDFYAVAYVKGNYVPPSGNPQGEAFFLLNFSPSKECTRFSYMTLSPEGYLYRYTRGLDELDSAEYALLHAWRDEQVPLNAWRLFPSSAIDEDAFCGDQAARNSYEEARHRVALIFFYARSLAWVSSKYPSEPMFRPTEDDYPQPMVNTPEYAEIEKYVLAEAARRNAKNA